MQDYTYSVFSIAAIAIHLILNFNMLSGRHAVTGYSTRYRWFLLSILAYYTTDAAWGILAGLHLMGVLYVETVFFFLSLAAFVFMWGNFVIVYLDLDKPTRRILYFFGGVLLLFNIAALAVNPFNNCFYHIDGDGVYRTGYMRDPAFYLLIAYNLLITIAGVASIDHACNGAEALAKLDSAMMAKHPYDFVLSDLWMPNMNGGEFIEKLRADARFDRLPCFALTADTEFHRDARTALFTGILLKPLTYAKLMKTFGSAA